MDIKFGKYKGKTVEEVAKTEKGRSWLGWLIDQPTEGDYKEANEKRNAYIRSVLSSGPEKEFPRTAEGGGVNINQVIISKLDTIIDLLSKKTGHGWDE